MLVVKFQTLSTQKSTAKYPKFDRCSANNGENKIVKSQSFIKLGKGRINV